VTSKADQSKNTTNSATLRTRFSLFSPSRHCLVASQGSSEPSLIWCRVVCVDVLRASKFTLHCLRQHFKSIVMNLVCRLSHMPSGNLHTSFYANDLEIIKMPPKLQVFMFENPLYLVISRSLLSFSLSRRAWPCWNVSANWDGLNRSFLIVL
jgi:hypothetical protein